MDARGIGDDRFDRTVPDSGDGGNSRSGGRVLDGIVEKVVEDLMQTLRVRRHRRHVWRHLEGKAKIASVGARAHHLDLLLKLATQVDVGDVKRNRARLHAGKV